MISNQRESRSKIREVRKRDNRIVPFDVTKIADAIYRALRSCGRGERALAAELAAAVDHFLQEKFRGSIPGIEDIQDLVETVLLEMGHTQVAKAYILYRQKRAMLRETVEVRKVRADPPAAGLEDDASSEGRRRHGYRAEAQGGHRAEAQRTLRVEADVGGVSRWSKSRIAAALIREAELDPGVAGQVASAVEQKVLGSGINRISSSLIRELVDNELFERGYEAKLKKQAPIGLPRYDIEQVIFGCDVKEGYTFPKTPPEVRKIIANRILHQFSLQEVFTPPVSDAHRDGRFFLHRLSDPLRLSCLKWSLPLPGGSDLGRAGGTEPPPAAGSREPPGGHRFSFDAATEGPESYLDVGDFFRRLAHLSSFFSEEIVLSGLSNLLQDPAHRALGVRQKALSVLERLVQLEERPRIVLRLELVAASRPWFEGLLEVSRRHPGRLHTVVVLRREAFEAGEPGAGILAPVAELFQRGEPVEFVAPAHDVLSDAPPGLTADVAKITINLPRVAFRSARDPRSSLERELDDILDLAVKGHLERRRFVERLGANRENPLWDLIGGAPTGQGPSGEVAAGPLLDLSEGGFGIGVLGLNECVKFLTGKELHQDDAARTMGLQIVRQMDRKLRRDARGLGLRLHLEETLNLGPLHGLERGDGSRYPQMAEIDRGRHAQWAPRYTDGVRLHRMAPLDPLRRVEELAPFLRHLLPAGGIVEDFPELRSSASDLLISLLEEGLPALDGEVSRGRGLE